MKILRLKVKTPQNIDLNSWEITHYISRFASYHYKSEVINELKGHIINGKKANNIFILSNSFRIDSPYKLLDNIHINETNIYSLLNMGKALPIFPNALLFKLNFSFTVLNFIYDHNPKLKKECKRKAYFLTHYKSFLTDNFIDFSREFCDKHFVGLKKVKFNSARKNIEKELRNYNALNKVFNVDLSKLNINDIESHAEKFKSKFAYLQRPVVGIIDNDNDTINILQVNTIQRNKLAKAFFQLTDLHKTNPFDFNIDSFGIIIKKILYREKEKLENESLERDIALKDQQIIKLKIQNMASAMKVLSRITDNNDLPANRRELLDGHLFNILQEIDSGLVDKATIISRGKSIEIKEIDILA